MKIIALKVLFAVTLFCSSTAILTAQETKQAEKPKQELETLASVDFSAESQAAYYSGYAFGGYGLEGETESKIVPAAQFTTQRAQTKDGKDGEGYAATFDTSKVKMPENVSYDYFGWGCGGGVDLANPLKATDLSTYSVSFDAKVEGCKPLSNSKLVVSFVLPDDQLKKDEDEFDDIVLRLTSGDENKGGLFTIGSEFKTFTFNLKKDFTPSKGAVTDLAKHEVKRMSFAVQAQGTLDDIGTDNDNRLIIDNVKLTKQK